jgi:hypothetical protein
VAQGEQHGASWIAAIRLGAGSSRRSRSLDAWRYGPAAEMAGDYSEDGRLDAMRHDTSKGPGLRLDERFPELWRGALEGT